MMALDLRLRPPRSPREALDGLLMMPRTIDKICATLPGGDPGPYIIVPGLSEIMLSIINIPLADLYKAVASGRADDDVAAWLRAHADVSRYVQANAVLGAMRTEHVPFDQREQFEDLYPGYLRARYPLLFDLLEADDGELYPALSNE